MHVLDQVRAERDQARAAALAIAEGDEFDPEDKAFLDLQTRADELDRRAGAIAAQLEKQAAADALDGRLSKIARRETPEPETRATWGERFTESDIFKGYHGGTSPRLEFDDIETRALPTGIAALVAAGLKGLPYQVDTTAPLAPTPLMDAASQIQVSGNAIEYIAWTKVAGGATKVAEGGAKPSAEFGPTVTSTTLDTFAVWTQLTRQLMEDAPAVRSMIDNMLRSDVAKAEEADAAAVVAAASATIPDVSNADLLAAIRMGVGTVQAAGYQPTAVMLNPADYAALDISVMGTSNSGPNVGANFWGLKPIAVPGQTAGTAVVGDFRSALHHYYRAQIALYVSDSHASTFISNVFTLLAERRSKTVVVRPTALVEAKKVP